MAANLKQTSIVWVMFDIHGFGVVCGWRDNYPFWCVILFELFVKCTSGAGAAQTDLLLNESHQFVLILKHMTTQMLQNIKKKIVLLSIGGRTVTGIVIYGSSNEITP